MNSSDQIKIQTFDNYVMRGGDQSLKNIEELCDYGFYTLGLGYEPEVFMMLSLRLSANLQET